MESSASMKTAVSEVHESTVPVIEYVRLPDETLLYERSMTRVSVKAVP
jgi:hypothetical protein